VLAEFVCLSCGHGWSGPMEAVSCPECGHLYVSLTNFAAMVEQSSRPRSLTATRPHKSPRALTLQPTPLRAVPNEADPP
jgi:hypothetical protein